MSKTSAAPEESPEEAVLFPAKAITLSMGRIVIVKPWGMTTGRLLAPRVAQLLKGLDKGLASATVVDVVIDAQEEVAEIIRITTGLTREEMEDETQFLYEDLFTLAQAVLEVCILRGKDAGGVMGKALALVATRNEATSADSTPTKSDGNAEEI